MHIHLHMDTYTHIHMKSYYKPHTLQRQDLEDSSSNGTRSFLLEE